jgi:hypothetical protein
MACNFDIDCPNGFICNNFGECIPGERDFDPAAQFLQSGNTCISDFDCPSGFSCDPSAGICVSTPDDGMREGPGGGDQDQPTLGGGGFTGGGGFAGTGFVPTPTPTATPVITPPILPTFRVTGISSPSVGGTVGFFASTSIVTTFVNSDRIPFGTTVPAYATPAQGYRFVGWSLNSGIESGGTIISTDNPYTFIFDESKVLVANFARVIDQYTAAVRTFPSNIASPRFTNNNQTTISGAADTLLEVTTNIPTGYRFVGWSFDTPQDVFVTGVTENSIPFSFALTKNTTVYANFEEIVDQPPLNPEFKIFTQYSTANQGTVQNLDESNTFFFTLYANNFTGPLYWRFEPVGGSPVVDSDFFNIVNPVSVGGQVNISPSAQTSNPIPVGVRADEITEGDEQFIIAVYTDSSRTVRVAQTEVITINDTSITRTCTPQVIRTFCQGCDEFSVYQYEDCSQEERLIRQDSTTCCPATPPPTPTPTPTPEPTWRLCSDGSLRTGFAPAGYRQVPYEGLGGGQCWEPQSDVGFIPALSSLTFDYQRGSSQYPVNYQFEVENPSYGLSYVLTFETNFRYFDISPRSIRLAPRDKKPFTISVNRENINEFADGQTEFTFNVNIDTV